MKATKKAKQREWKLKKVPFDKMTASDIKFLENRGIINWIWPESYWRFKRWLMSFIFSMVLYKKHDVWFWQQVWFCKANQNLLLDSYEELAQDYIKICHTKWYKKIYLVPKYYLTLPIKAWVIALAYTAVESPLGEKAYSNAK